MADAFQATLARLRGDGVSIRPLPIAGLLGDLAEAATKVMTFEGARVHEQPFLPAVYLANVFGPPPPTVTVLRTPRSQARWC